MCVLTDRGLGVQGILVRLPA